MNKNEKTAAAVIRELEKSEEYMHKVRTSEKKIEKTNKIIKEEEKDIIFDLRKIGYKVEYLSDLINYYNSYVSAIPVLLKHLDKKYSKGTLEFLVRALITDEARGLAGTRLIRLFKKVDDENLRWVIGCAIGETADEKELESLLDLLRNASYGEARSGLIRAVARIEGQPSAPFIQTLLDDNSKIIKAEAMAALAELGFEESKLAIEALLNHEDPWIRERAKKALSRLAR